MTYPRIEPPPPTQPPHSPYVQPTSPLLGQDQRLLPWVAGRLQRLGYYSGPLDPPNLAALESALYTFKNAQRLPETVDILDITTRRQLATTPPPIMPDDVPPAPVETPTAPLPSATPTPELDPPRPERPPATIPDVALVADLPVYAIETIRCEGSSGVWALAYEGDIATLADPEISVRLRKRIGFRYHPEHEGVDPTDWWCIPTRRYCYSEVKFTSWQGAHKPDEIVNFPAHAVFPVEKSLEQGLQAAIAKRCPE